MTAMDRVAIGAMGDTPREMADLALKAENAGGFLLMEDMSMAGSFTLEQVASNHPNFVPQEMLAKIENELQRIK